MSELESNIWYVRIIGMLTQLVTLSVMYFSLMVDDDPFFKVVFLVTAVLLEVQFRIATVGSFKDEWERYVVGVVPYRWYDLFIVVRAYRLTKVDPNYV
jgi:hypothetical protein